MTFTVQDEGNTILPNVGDLLSKNTHWDVHTHTHTHTTSRAANDNRVDSADSARS